MNYVLWVDAKYFPVHAMKAYRVTEAQLRLLFTWALDSGE